MRVQDFMSPNVVTVDEKTSIGNAGNIMEPHGIRRLQAMKKKNP